MIYLWSVLIMVCVLGDLFWLVDPVSRSAGPPQSITDTLGVPSPIDTTFTRCNCHGNIYIIKVQRAQRQSETRLWTYLALTDTGKEKKENTLTNNEVWWWRSELTSLSWLQGEQFWRLNGKMEMEPGYPKPLATEFPGLTGNINAALAVPATRTRPETVFFFKNGRQYRNFLVTRSQLRLTLIVFVTVLSCPLSDRHAAYLRHTKFPLFVL